MLRDFAPAPDRAPPGAGLTAPSAGPPREVLSGRAHLCFFTAVQLIVYFDRSLVAGLVREAEAKFDLTGFDSGLLGSGFMGGFIIASPVVALMTGPTTAKIMGVGLGIWLLAAFVAGVANSYSWLLAARIAAGAGEAAYCSLAPPVIDDTAPEGMGSVYLSVYFSSIFVGMATGYVASAPCATWDEARIIFFLEALAMVPFVAYIIKHEHRFQSAGVGSEAARPPSHSGLELPRLADASAASGGSRSWIGAAPLPWWQQIGAVMQSRTYCLVMLGYSASIFSLGGFAFWVPEYIGEVLKIKKAEGQRALGGMTATSGILGTVFGGLLLDAMTQRWSASGKTTESGLGVRGRVAVRIAFRCSLISVPFVLVAVASMAVWLFYAGLAVGQLFVFMSTAPVNVAMMEAMPSELRGLAMGICTTLTHCLGDVLSPVLIGKVKDWCDDLTPGIWLLALWPLWSVVFWGWAAKIVIAQ